MLEMFKYTMHIIDNEFGDEYDYVALFHDHFEAADFLDENTAAGNIVIITKHSERVFVNPEVLNQLNPQF